MNALDLAQRIHLILRVGSEAPGTEPVAFAGQVGVLGEITRWVNAAYSDIVRQHNNWTFMLLDGEATLAAGTSDITLAAWRAAVPGLDRLSPYVGEDYGFVLARDPAVANAAEHPVALVPFQKWHGHHDAGPRPGGMPTRCTISPNGDLLFNSTPDRAYTVRSLYSRMVTPLAVDADEPIIPVEHHELIVWWAIVRYYCVSRDGTAELRQKAQVELTRELTAMRNRWLPAITLG